MCDQLLLQRPNAVIADAEGMSDRRQHKFGIADGTEFNEADAGGEVRRDVTGNL